MDRKNRYRRLRKYNLRITTVLIVFLLIVISGLLIVDMNKNYILYGEQRIELVQIEPGDNDMYVINVLNKRYSLNLKYIKRDLSIIKSFFK